MLDAIYGVTASKRKGQPDEVHDARGFQFRPANRPCMQFQAPIVGCFCPHAEVFYISPSRIHLNDISVANRQALVRNGYKTLPVRETVITRTAL